MLNPRIGKPRWDDDSPPRRGGGSPDGRAGRGGGERRREWEDAAALAPPRSAGRGRLYATTPGGTRRVAWRDEASTSTPSVRGGRGNLEDVREMSADRSGGGGGGGASRERGRGRAFGARVILDSDSDKSEDDLFVGTPSGGSRWGGNVGGGVGRLARRFEEDEASPEVTAGWGGKPWRAWGGKTPGGASDMSSEWATPRSVRYDDEDYPMEDVIYDTPATEMSELPAHAHRGRAPVVAAAYHRAVAAANSNFVSARHSSLSRVSRGAAAAPAAVAAAAVAAAADNELIRALEAQHAASVDRIQALQTTLDVREVQLSESKGALKEVQTRLVGALAAVGDDVEAVEDIAGANGDGLVGRAEEDARGGQQGDEAMLLLRQYEREMKRMARDIEEIKREKLGGNSAAVPMIRQEKSDDLSGSRVRAETPAETPAEAQIRAQTQAKAQSEAQSLLSKVTSTSRPARPPQTETETETRPPTPSRPSTSQPPSASVPPSSLGTTSTRGMVLPLGTTGRHNFVDSPMRLQRSEAEVRPSVTPAPPPATTSVPNPASGFGTVSPTPSSRASSPSGVKSRVRWQHPEHLDLENTSQATAAQTSIPRWPGRTSVDKIKTKETAPRSPRSSSPSLSEAAYLWSGRRDRGGGNSRPSPRNTPRSSRASVGKWSPTTTPSQRSSKLSRTASVTQLAASIMHKLVRTQR